MHRHAQAQGMRIAILLLVLFGLIEVAVSFLVNSLALRGDGYHMLFDAAGLIPALIAAAIAERQDRALDQSFTRAAGALASAVLLLPAALALVIDGLHRIGSPEVTRTTIMILTASLGLVVNRVCLRLVPHYHDDLNIRSARVHLLGDYLNSLAVILGGLVIAWTRWFWIDGLLALGIGTFLAVQGMSFAIQALRMMRNGNGH